MQLEVLTGNSEGQVFDVPDEVIIGRGEECTIRLTDTSVSTRHAKILTHPKPQVIDLGSSNGIAVNGTRKNTAELFEGDVINIGGVTLRVVLDTGAKAAEADRAKKRRLMAVIVSLVLLIGILAGSWYLLQNYQRRTAPLAAVSITPKPKLNVPGVEVHLPGADDFNAPITAYRAFTSDFLTVANKRGYESASELQLIEILPPDPLSISFRYDRRSWIKYPPRLGSGRFLPTAGMVLDRYACRGVALGKDDWSNPTPEAFLSRIGNPESPIRLEFYVEVWTGLPADAEIPFLGLDKASGDPLFEQIGLVPKNLEFIVPRANFVEPRTDWEQNAAGFLKMSGEDYRYYRIRQVKKGGVLAIFTAKSFAWHEPRLAELMEDIVMAQKVVGREVDKPEERVAEALALEQEADDLLPGILQKTEMSDWNVIPDKWTLFKCFNRYHLALVRLQQADRWPHDDDYRRIFSKAEAIYNYVHHPDSHFRRSYNLIESSISEVERFRPRTRDDQRLERVKKQELVDRVNEFYDMTRRGMEPERFPVLDEWFIYAHLRRLYVTKRYPI